MKFIFFGSPKFASIILEKLINVGFIPEAVVCNPDRPVGRKKIITAPPVKARIMNYELRIRNKIKILQPEKLDEKFHNSLFILHNSLDLFIVAAYSKIIPKEILKIPHLGTIGVHPSLLPKYRGSSPIQSALLNGDETTGTTIFLIDEKMDHGPIVIKSEIRISKSETYESLLNKLAELSADLLIENLSDIEKKFKSAKPQNESLATYTKKFRTEDAFVKPEDLEKAQKNGGDIAFEIERKIRALNPEPGVFTFIKGKRIKLLEAQIIPSVDGEKLKPIKIQTEGKKPVILSF